MHAESTLEVEPGLGVAPAGREAEVWPTDRGLAYEAGKRAIDILISSLLLLLLAPVMLAIAALIKLDSPGPVLFRHRRIARLRSPIAPPTPEAPVPAALPSFPLFKFRSMFADARERFPELYTYEFSPEELDCVPIKVIVARDPRLRFGNGRHPDLETFSDPRVTRIGRWLRRTSLDELPNFLSVLRGDMSLVGPRPDIAENVAYYAPAHLRKLAVKPGITGLAQIRGRGHLSFNEVNEHDVEYVERRSFWFDLLIMLKTIPAVLRTDGAR